MATVVRPVRPPWTRPAAPAIGGVLLAAAWMFAMAAFGNRYGDGLGWFGVAAVGVLLAVPVVLALTYLVLRRRVRLEVDGGVLTLYDLRGRRTAVDSAAVRSVHDLVLATRLEQRSATVVAGLDGSVVLTLWHKTWSHRDLTRLWPALGWPLRDPEALPVEAARTRFPGIRVPVGFTKPGRTGMLAALGVLGYAAVWVFVMVTITTT